MRSAKRRSLLSRLAVAVATTFTTGFALALAPAVPAVASSSVTTSGSASPLMTNIVVDRRQPGRVFDGVGAISGGGATSRLLLDYPRRQQNQILDYLFKPDYGASLQLLKVEIGGDTDSTDGSESSIEHSRGAINCDAGYEWWLMEQALKRNPNIRLGALEWGAPGWIGGDTPMSTYQQEIQHFFSADNINYILAWLGCAKRHGLHIYDLGVWNERAWEAGWIEQLRTALDAHGYASTKIVAPDGQAAQLASDMTTDPALEKAVGIVGIHYPVHSSTPTEQSLGKPLWASEDGNRNPVDLVQR